MISIIVPVLNDAAALRRSLYGLVAEKNGHEVIVVDGGSMDGSVELAKSHPWVSLVKGAGEFPKLCNLGAEKASGDVLLFLPPGIVLERGWAAAVEEAAKRERFGIGCFRLHIEGQHVGFRLAEALATFSTLALQGARAYQALFVRSSVAANPPVFRDVPGLEDADLCFRHGLRGKVVQLPLAAMNTEQRWQDKGVLTTLAHDFLSVWRWRRGESPERVSADYGASTEAVLLFYNPGKSRTATVPLRSEIDKSRAEKIERGVVEQVLLTVSRAHLELEPFVYFHPKSARDELVRWVGDKARLVAETGRTLTQRRKQAFASILSMPYHKVLMVGAHCPAMTERHLKRALRELDRRDIVLGPTDDGGCYLVGVKSPHPELFDQLQWTPDGLCREIIAAAEKLGLSVVELEVLHDLDSAADLRYNWAMGFIQN